MHAGICTLLGVQARTHVRAHTANLFGCADHFISVPQNLLSRPLVEIHRMTGDKEGVVTVWTDARISYVIISHCLQHETPTS